jgi:hypothetical protein
LVVFGPVLVGFHPPEQVEQVAGVHFQLKVWRRRCSGPRTRPVGRRLGLRGHRHWIIACRPVDDQRMTPQLRETRAARELEQEGVVERHVDPGPTRIT